MIKIVRLHNQREVAALNLLVQCGFRHASVIRRKHEFWGFQWKAKVVRLAGMMLAIIYPSGLPIIRSVSKKLPFKEMYMDNPFDAELYKLPLEELRKKAIA